MTVHCLGPWSVDVIVIRDLSFGGFSVMTTHSVPPGILTHFEFLTSSGFSMTLPARAIFGRALPLDGTRQRFISGWEFLGTSDHRKAIEHLLDAATASVTV